MNSEITLLARGAKCGFLGANGVVRQRRRTCAASAPASREQALLIQQPGERQRR